MRREGWCCEVGVLQNGRDSIVRWEGQCCKIAKHPSYVSNIINCLPINMTKHRHGANLWGVLEVCH